MKVFLDTVGCRLNQSEIEKIGQQFQLAGHTIVASAAEADLAVVNTCAVTNEAVSDSRQKIRAIARKGTSEIIATGCWATMDPGAAAQLPGVQHIVPNLEKDSLVQDFLRNKEISGPGFPGQLAGEGSPAGGKEIFDLEPLKRERLPGLLLRTRAFIKVQDGCDNRCTFCITTLLRGPGRSRPVEAILQDIQAALAGGTQEIVLTGVHLGSWGHDFDSPRHLMHLIQAILRRTEVPRLRLSSLEPWDLDEEFFALWQGEPRLCRHLHLPLQSGCDSTLRRMARKTTQASFLRLVEAARKASPEIAITTDLIAGFPGETEREFDETLAFIQKIHFAGGHIFPYSDRPGTAAARMPGQVPHPVRKQRGALLRQAIQRDAHEYSQRFWGRSMPVLWEQARSFGPEGWQMTGLTDNYLRVNAVAPRDLWNTITLVKINSIQDLPEDGASERGLQGVL